MKNTKNNTNNLNKLSSIFSVSNESDIDNITNYSDNNDNIIIPNSNHKPKSKSKFIPKAKHITNNDNSDQLNIVNSNIKETTLISDISSKLLNNTNINLLKDKYHISDDTINKAHIYLDFKNNPIKFIESNIFVPLPQGDTIITLDQPQKDVINDFLKYHYIIILKSRQTGFSTLSQAIITYISTFYENCIMGIISRDASESSDFCRKTEDMIDKIPLDWLKPSYKVKSALSFHLTNGCKLYSAAISPANPQAVLRGKSVVLLIIDEAAHIRNIDKAWEGIGMSLSRAQQSANFASIPFGTIILSTPNQTEGIGKWYFVNWNNAVQNNSIFKPKEIHWSQINTFKNDPAWFHNQCAILNFDKNKIAQELELKFVGSGDSVFDEKIQTIIQNSSKNPSKSLDFGNNNTMNFFHPDDADCVKGFVLAGIDCSSGYGGFDASSIIVAKIFRKRGNLYSHSNMLHDIHNSRVTQNISNNNSTNNSIFKDMSYFENDNKLGNNLNLESNNSLFEDMSCLENNNNLKNRNLNQISNKYKKNNKFKDTSYDEDDEELENENSNDSIFEDMSCLENDKNSYENISDELEEEIYGGITSMPMEILCEFKGKLLVHEFVNIIKYVCNIYKNNILIIERNSYGNQIIEELSYDTEHEYNIFGYRRGTTSRSVFVPGLDTNVKTRPLIMDAMYNFVRTYPESIISKKLGLELIGLINKRGRIEAGPGCNDDMVMSLGFICYVVQYARELLPAEDVEFDYDIANEPISDSINMISKFNNSSHPMYGTFKNENYSDFKKELTKFVHKEACNTLVGPVDILSLFKKSNDFFLTFDQS